MDEEKSDPLELTVKEALDMFRPQLQADGGDMEYISIDDQNRVHLRLIGACGGCPMATMTIKMGIERYLKDAVPEITEVVQEI
ncbi:MAG: NifU family protein [Treponema sp.]|jgi:Fe-S cluster biogenesis protein NfuA|nr:NifU family protein [Treponema sp.]